MHQSLFISPNSSLDRLVLSSWQHCVQITPRSNNKQPTANKGISSVGNTTSPRSNHEATRRRHRILRSERPDDCTDCTSEITAFGCASAYFGCSRETPQAQRRYDDAQNPPLRHFVISIFPIVSEKSV